MNNENLDVLEMEQNPNLVFDSNNINGEDMADDFFDDDLVNLDFNGLDSNNIEFSAPMTEVVNEQPVFVMEEPVQENTFVNNFSEPSVQDVVATQPIVETENVDTIVEDNNVNVQEIIETASDVEPETKKVNKKGNSDNYNLSNFDVLFDSLYSDVAGANDLITNLIEKKSSLNKNEKLLEDFKEKFEKEKEDFRNFVEVQKKAIESEKEQAASFIESKRARLHTEEAKFNEDSEAKKTEISLLEQALKLEREKFETEKANFEEQNRLELEKIKNEREKLQRDLEQFEIDKKLSEDLIKNGKKDLQSQQEQFARYKELEQKKLDLEEKNLSQSCARFKELVSQFNSGFEQLPNEDK